MIRVGKTKTGYLLVAAIMVLTIATPIIRQQIVSAATLTVNSILDTSDSNAGNGSCDDGAGNCTLRAAIEEANALGGPNTINFNIPGAGVHTITPLSTLTIDSQITIDGSTQPGANCGELVPTSLPAQSNTHHTILVTIAGGSGAPGNTFEFNATTSDSSTIKGLNITNATEGAASLLLDGAQITAECNYIGTDSAGDFDAIGIAGGGGLIDPTSSNGIIGSTTSSTITNNLFSNNESAISLGGSDTLVTNNLIGTDASGRTSNGGLSADGPSNITGIKMTGIGGNRVIEHNIIVRSAENGIDLDNAYNVSLRSNYIGLDMAGGSSGNEGDGVAIHGGSNSIFVGGVQDERRNVISANSGSGIHIYKTQCDDDPRFNLILNNYIGTSVDGQVSSGYGNHLSGVTINEYNTTCQENSVYRNRIGGDTDDDDGGQHEANIIAGNLEDGVRIYQSPGSDVRENPVVGNSIFSNGNLGINLAEDTNDDGVADADLGRNETNSLDINNPTEKANSYLNSPTINSVTATAGQLDINYDFVANPADPSVEVVGYRLDFYLNDGLNGDGHGEGQRHLGFFLVDGSETGVTHSFTTSAPITDNVSNVTATTTALISNGCPCGFNNHSESRSLLSRVSNFFMPKASAQEVTIDAGTYDLGPTSEFSLASIVNPLSSGGSGQAGSSSSSSSAAATLVDTGQNITGTTLFVDTVAALAVGVVGYLAVRSRRRHFIRSR